MAPPDALGVTHLRTRAPSHDFDSNSHDVVCTLPRIYHKRILKRIYEFAHAPRRVRLNHKDVHGRTAQQCAELMGHADIATAIAVCQRGVVIEAIRRHLLRVSQRVH